MRTEPVFVTHGFGPFFRPDSRWLILGSFPSVRSREASFYYAHPRNRFWKILAAVFEDGVPEETEAKQAFLIRHRVALYDVIESCRITGSSDSSIRDVTVTDLRPVLAGSGVGDRVFANGARAFDLYMRWQYPVTGIRPVKLPSSSPANAAWSLDRLTGVWRGALKGIV